MFMLTQSESESIVTNAGEPRRYTYRQLNAQAKQAFSRIQKSTPDGGLKHDYQYKGWDLVVNDGNILQIVKYDVVRLETTLKRSSVIILLKLF
jgi:hypothetical protein